MLNLEASLCIVSCSFVFQFQCRVCVVFLMNQTGKYSTAPEMAKNDMADTQSIIIKDAAISGEMPGPFKGGIGRNGPPVSCDAERRCPIWVRRDGGCVSRDCRTPAHTRRRRVFTGGSKPAVMRSGHGPRPMRWKRFATRAVKLSQARRTAARARRCSLGGLEMEEVSL